jgi:hypothetical protein
MKYDRKDLMKTASILQKEMGYSKKDAVQSAWYVIKKVQIANETLAKNIMAHGFFKDAMSPKMSIQSFMIYCKRHGYNPFLKSSTVVKQMQNIKL